jgi:hypothetical protein
MISSDPKEETPAWSETKEEEFMPYRKHNFRNATTGQAGPTSQLFSFFNPISLMHHKCNGLTEKGSGVVSVLLFVGAFF